MTIKISGGIGITYPDGSVAESAFAPSKFEADSLRAKINSILYPTGPVPVFDQVFSHGASMLDPRITFTSGERTYIDNGVLKTAPANTPVFENGAWRLRPQETNLIVADIAAQNWNNSLNRLTVGSVAQFAGFSLRQATVAVGSAVGAYVQWTPQITISPGRVTLSVYLRHDTPGWSQLMLRDDSKAGTVAVFFNVASGTVGQTSATPGSGMSIVNAALEALGEGVWRLDLVIQTDGTQIRPYLYGQVAGDGNTSSEGLVGNVWYAAVQVNQGDPIPYIPTTTSQVTVPADSALIQGAAFSEVFNTSEGAIVFNVCVDANRGSLGVGRIASWYSDGDDYAELRHNSNYGSVAALSYIGGASAYAADIVPSGYVYGTFMKIGMSWDGSSVSFFLNGAKLTDKSNFKINRFVLGGGLGVRHKNLTIFPRRPLDAEMEALTS